MPFACLNHSGLGGGGTPHTDRDMSIEKNARDESRVRRAATDNQ